jgi:predicted RNA-binding protein
MDETAEANGVRKRWITPKIEDIWEVLPDETVFGLQETTSNLALGRSSELQCPPQCLPFESSQI